MANAYRTLGTATCRALSTKDAKPSRSSQLKENRRKIAVANSRLPIEYKQLEARVDALKDVHQKMLKITKVYETETVSGSGPANLDWSSVTAELECASLLKLSVPDLLSTA